MKNTGRRFPRQGSQVQLAVSILLAPVFAVAADTAGRVGIKAGEPPRRVPDGRRHHHRST